ncbi:helix-turn-helix domain-containing protein [Chloroflexota bacterium]
METKEFGARLKELREQAGLSQGQLADKVGVNFTYLSKIESGVMPPPSEKVILRLAEVLDADRDELITLAGKVPSDIAEMLKSRGNLQLLRSGRTHKKIRSANKKEGFNIRLRELRKRAGLSQRELADKVGVNFTYLSKIESGVMPPPSEEVILKLAEVLNTDRDELMALAGKVPSDIAEMLKSRESLQSLRSGRTPRKIGAANKKEGISIMKNLMNYRSFSRVAIAIVLACAVATSLWFVSPLPVQALKISFPSPPASGTLGSTHSFTVKVEIEDQDLLPVESIDLEIYKISNPTNYKVSLANLPIPNVPDATETKSYTSTQTGGGAVSVSATTGPWWGTGTGSRMGYGYRDPEGWGYHDPFSGSFGYGYGYGSLQGPTWITYTIRWTSPSTWPSGAYEVKTLVYGDGSKKFSGTSSSFTLSVAEEDDEGPATGVPPKKVVIVKPGVVDVSRVVRSDGSFTQTVTVQSPNKLMVITIEKGNRGKTGAGARVTKITIRQLADPPPPPPNAHIVGLTYDLNAGGGTFENPVTISLTYDPDKLPEGVNDEDLVVAWYDEDAGQWVELATVVDPETNIITAQITHFSKYAVIARAIITEPPVVEPPVVEPPVVEPPVVEPPVVEPPVVKPPVVEPPVVEPPVVEPPVVEPPVEEPAPIAWWIWLIVGVVAAAVIAGIIWLVIRRRTA